MHLLDSDVLVVAIDSKQMEELWVKHLVFLGKDEDYAPQIADQPCVNALITTVGSDEDVGDLRQKAFEGELLEVSGKRVFIDVYNLVCH